LLVIAYIGYNYYLKSIDTKEFVQKLKRELSTLHKSSSYNYPRFSEFNSAIYDIDKNLIFSTLSNELESLESQTIGDTIYTVDEQYPYYLGAKYVVIEHKSAKLDEIKRIILYIFLLSTLFISVIGYFLAKLFLKPMREVITLLDRFIKDTTHELNTPVSTILINLQTMSSESLPSKDLKRLKRVELASKTISNLYDDLVFLTLNHKKSSENEFLDFSAILRDRLEYFSLFIESKKLSLDIDIDSGVEIFIDRHKLGRLIDNIISNAIKYNVVEGRLSVKLSKSEFVVQDSGIGIDRENLSQIFSRYSRFTETVGGFGIGLDIVMQIVREYNFQIEIESEKDSFTRVVIKL
jgi:two-component system OmpR family sensor kinase